MTETDEATYSVFIGSKRVAQGTLRAVLPRLRQHATAGDGELALVFDDETGQQVDFDLRLDEGAPGATTTQSRKPGRPKLGVVAREVTLFPRHWDWLELQPNGASAALRRLVEQARKAEPHKDRARRMRAALNRVMTALAGDLPGYEEATRALFAADQASLEKLVRGWPSDIRAHVLEHARAAMRMDSAEPGDVHI